jgi:hypothetical protein
MGRRFCDGFLTGADLPVVEGRSWIQIGDLKLTSGDLDLPGYDSELPGCDLGQHEGDFELPGGDFDPPGGDLNLPGVDFEMVMGDLFLVGIGWIRVLAAPTPTLPRRTRNKSVRQGREITLCPYAMTL